MRYAYFDTTIFNHLYGQDIQKWVDGPIENINELESLLKKNNIHPVSSSQVLGELTITSQSNQSKTIEMCSIYKILIDGRIIRCWKDIIKDEYECCYIKSSYNVDIYFNKYHQVYKQLSKYTIGDFSDKSVSKFSKEEPTRKKVNRERLIKSVKGYSPKAKEKIEKMCSFEIFWSEILEDRDYLKKRIIEVLNAYNIGRKYRKDEDANAIIDNLGSLVFWNSLLRVEPVLTWDYIKKNGKIDKGDSFDMSDSIHCAFLSNKDIIVSDDGRFRQRCQLLYPQIQTRGLKEYIKELIND